MLWILFNFLLVQVQVRLCFPLWTIIPRFSNKCNRLKRRKITPTKQLLTNIGSLRCLKERDQVMAYLHKERRSLKLMASWIKSAMVGLKCCWGSTTMNIWQIFLWQCIFDRSSERHGHFQDDQCCRYFIISSQDCLVYSRTSSSQVKENDARHQPIKFIKKPTKSTH